MGDESEKRPFQAHGRVARQCGMSTSHSLGENELDELQALLDRLPAPLEPLDVSMLDGFLCGVLLQPQRVPEARWPSHLADIDARSVPAGVDSSALHTLVRRRHAELDQAIARRQWFDPWV